MDGAVINDPDSKITTAVKTKDPKRVEAGKKLAAISKAAKEKKMRKMIEMEKSLNNSNDGMGNVNKTVYMLITLAVVIAILYLRPSINSRADDGKENVVIAKTVTPALENL